MVKIKTLCIKTNNKIALNYLLDNLKTLDIKDVYFSCHKFKIYNNIIIHYKGNNLDLFISSISNLLTFLVLDVFEEIITEKILQHDYFYFNNIEKKQISNKIIDTYLENYDSFEIKENLLFCAFHDFFENNNKLFLKGFITFRLKPYIEELEKTVNTAVNEYIIQKEYYEFVSLLKLYINSEESKADFVHLIYNNENAFLLDENNNIIKTDINLLNAKYLSDISFSSSDMVLNTLLNIIPKKIYIHVLNDQIDEFINTLKLVFENRVVFCNK